MFTIVQNFICSKPERLEVVRRNIKKFGNIFSDVDFFINFNSNVNLEEIYEIYNKNIPNLYFANNLEEDWAIVTLALVENIKTPYIIYLCEDMEANDSKEEIYSFLNEFFEENCDYGFLSKIKKYIMPVFINGNPGYNDSKTHFPPYKELKYSYIYPGKYARHKRIGLDAIYRTEWFKWALRVFLKNRKYCKHPIPYKNKNLPNYFEGYWDFDNGIKRFPNWKCALPKKELFREFDDVKDKEGK